MSLTESLKENAEGLLTFFFYDWIDKLLCKAYRESFLSRFYTWSPFKRLEIGLDSLSNSTVLDYTDCIESFSLMQSGL